MELLMWHDGLGSDDEQATQQELLARLLYFCDLREDATPNRSSDPPQRKAEDANKQLVDLQFMQALVTFTRLMQRRSNSGGNGHNTGWISVTLAHRRVFVQEVEPQIYVAMATPITLAQGQTDDHVAQKAVSEAMYDSFCVFYGKIADQLQTLPDQLHGRFDDGVAMLQHLGSVRKRLRKLAIQAELEETFKDADQRVEDLVSELQQEAATLEELSPSRRFWQRWDGFFPRFARAIDGSRITLFHDLHGLEYLSMDRDGSLLVQSLINRIECDLSDVVLPGGIALFYKGHPVSIGVFDASLRAVHMFLRLREQDGLDLASDPRQDHNHQSLWMDAKYDDAFSPVWASRTTYAECALAHHVAPYPRRTDRSLHKCTPSSLNTLVAELASTSELPPLSELVMARRGRRYCSDDAPVYRNRGFLTRNGYYIPGWELVKSNSSDQPWCPAIVLGLKDGKDTTSRVVVWHERDLTLITIVKNVDDKQRVGDAIVQIEDLLEKLQFVDNVSPALVQAQGLSGVGSQSRDRSSPQQPPTLYLNRQNRAFRAENIPRLIKTKDDDVFPRPSALWAHYFPPKTLQLLNYSHQLLHSNEDNVELQVKTVQDGWLVARNSNAVDRQLYTMFDTKVASLADVHDAVNGLLQSRFSTIFQ